MSSMLIIILLIAGVGGNLVAVQASRQSTALHFTATLGHLPEQFIHGCPNPLKIFFGKGETKN